MADPIETKLTVQSDQWEAGFAAARKSAKHFGDEVESTTERVKEKLESLKSSFGRRGLLGEGLETLMGGGAIAGFGIALEALNKLKEGAEEIFSAATGEEEKREVLAAKTNMQAEAAEAVLSAQKRVNEQVEKNLELIDKFHDQQDKFAVSSVGDPVKRQTANINLEYDQKAKEARKADTDRQDKAMEDAAKSIAKINDEAEKAVGEAQKKVRESGVTGSVGRFIGRQIGSAEGVPETEVGTGIYDASNAAIAQVEKARKSELAASEAALNLQLGLIEREKQAKLASLAAEAQGKLKYQVDDSKGLREFSGGSEAAGLRANGADEGEIKSAYELQKQVQDGLITKEQEAGAIAEQLATKKAAAEQQVVMSINGERASQDALIQTMERGAVAGGQVNKVLEQLAAHHLPEGDAEALLAQAQAADTAAEHVKELAKAYDSVRNIETESANIQNLLSRGVDVKWVTQLAGMGAAAMDAGQLNEAISQLEKNEAISHLVQREKQAEDGLRSLGEKVDDLQSMLDKGVDAKFIQQLAGMGALNDTQMQQAEDRIAQEEKINNIISARKQIEDQTIALRAKQLNESVEDYKLRQQGDGADADKLKNLERIGRQIEANRQLAERETESRNRDSTKEVRNHYAAIQSLDHIGNVTIPADGENARAAAGRPGGQYTHVGYRGARGSEGMKPADRTQPGRFVVADFHPVNANEPARPAGDAGGADPELMSWLRDIRNAALDNLAKVAQF